MMTLRNQPSIKTTKDRDAWFMIHITIFCLINNFKGQIMALVAATVTLLP
jgi:hypothetical protein